jgi:lysozyme family protein
MADFDEAYKNTMLHEGGYVHDPDDPGGETYRGISRRYHPGWNGWAEIDGMKDRTDFPECLDHNSALQSKIGDFYKQHYWDKFLGDEVPNQDIAEELFDTGVNLGVWRAVTYLQIGLNILNRNQRIYSDIDEDGGFGSITLATLRRYLSLDSPEYLLKIMNILQGMHYIDRMQTSPVQEKYARGWLKRVEFKKG